MVLFIQRTNIIEDKIWIPWYGSISIHKSKLYLFGYSVGKKNKIVNRLKLKYQKTSFVTCLCWCLCLCVLVHCPKCHRAPFFFFFKLAIFLLILERKKTFFLWTNSGDWPKSVGSPPPNTMIADTTLPHKAKWATFLLLLLLLFCFFWFFFFFVPVGWRNDSVWQCVMWCWRKKILGWRPLQRFLNCSQKAPAANYTGWKSPVAFWDTSFLPCIIQKTEYPLS